MAQRRKPKTKSREIRKQKTKKNPPKAERRKSIRRPLISAKKAKLKKKKLKKKKLRKRIRTYRFQDFDGRSRKELKLEKPKRRRKKTKSSKILKAPSYDSAIHQTKIRVLGIGGGGGSIISEIASRVRKVDFVAVNTDSRSLRELAKQVKRFQFGQRITRGLGTGMNVELGEIAAQEDKEKIRKLLEGQDLCIIVACLGGGTGSGATQVFAKISRGLGNLTYGIFTLPFEFEGEKKMEIAKDSLEKIKPYLNAYSVIPNERIFQIIDKNTPLKNALSSINKRLAENLEGLIETIYLPSLINIDFADLKTILSGHGRLTYLNTLEIEKVDKEGIARRLISSPLYPYTIKGARGILYNITSGKNLQLSEVSQISKTISESVNKKAKIIFGVSQGQKYQDRIKITLLATGCGIKGFFKKTTSALESSKKQKTKAVQPENKKKIKKESGVKTRKKTKKTKSRKFRPRTILKSKPKPKSIRKKPLTEGKKKAKIQVKEGPSRSAPSEKKLLPPVSEASLTESEKEKNETTVGNRYAEGPANPATSSIVDGKIRRSALQVKKAVEEEEKEILEREKAWETPAILRRKKENL